MLLVIYAGSAVEDIILFSQPVYMVGKKWARFLAPNSFISHDKLQVPGIACSNYFP